MAKCILIEACVCVCDIKKSIQIDIILLNVLKKDAEKENLISLDGTDTPYDSTVFAADDSKLMHTQIQEEKIDELN